MNWQVMLNSRLRMIVEAAGDAYSLSDETGCPCGAKRVHVVDLGGVLAWTEHAHDCDAVGDER